MYFNVNFNVFFKLIKVHLLVSELYIYQTARCNKKKYKLHCSFYICSSTVEVADSTLIKKRNLLFVNGSVRKGLSSNGRKL